MSFEIPAELLGKHLGDTEAEDVPTPAEESDEPTDEVETEEEESGDDEPVDENEEVVEDSDTEDEEEPEKDSEEPEPEDEDDELPKFDRKAIEKSPELKAAYKHMQAVLTKRTQALAEQRKHAEARIHEATELARQARQVLDSHKEFLERMASDEGAEAFLVEVALKRPKVFQAAFDRAAELVDDERARARFEREREQERKEADLTRREREIKQQQEEQRRRAIDNVMTAQAKALGVKPEVARRYVLAMIQEKVHLEGQSTITKEDIIRAVKQAASDLGTEREKAKKFVARENVKRLVKAKTTTRRAVPGSTAVATGGKAKKFEAPAGIDPLEYAVDKALGLIQ